MKASEREHKINEIINNTDLNEIMSVIKKTGDKSYKDFCETYKKIISYITNTAISDKHEYKNPIYFDTEQYDGQVFGNNNTSLFYVSRKIFNFEKLFSKTRLIVPQAVRVNEQEMKYLFSYAKKMCGQSLKSVVYSESPYKNKKDNVVTIDYFSKEEMQLANILLNNPEFKLSDEKPAIYAESDVGRAYIFGRRQTITKKSR